MEPIVIERATVDRLEVARRLDDGRLDLERIDLAHGVGQHRAGGHPAAEPDHGDPIDPLGGHQRQMPKQGLRLDVTGAGGRIGLAIDLQQDVAVDLLDGDRRGRAVAVKQQLVRCQQVADASIVVAGVARGAVIQTEAERQLARAAVERQNQDDGRHGRGDGPGVRSRQPDGGDDHQSERDQHPDLHQHVQPNARQQQPGRGQRAGGRAEQVRGVERGHHRSCAQAACHTDDHRQQRAETQRGRQHQKRRQQELHAEEPGGPTIHPAVQIEETGTAGVPRQTS